MEDNYDNFSDFLKNKLNEFDGADDAWDRPDQNVRELVQAQLVTASPKGKWLVPLILIGAVGVLLLSFGIYSWKSKHNNEAREETIPAKKELENGKETVFFQGKKDRKPAEVNANQAAAIIENASSNLILATKNVALMSQIREQEKIIAQLSKKQVQRRPNEAKTSALEQQIQAQQRIIDRLENENRFLKENAVKATTSPIAINKNEAAGLPMNTRETTQDKLDVQVIPSRSMIVKQVSSPSFLSTKLAAKTVIPMPPKSKQHRFKLGYEYALLGINFPVERSIEDKERKGKLKAYESFTHANGGYFSYSPKRNWWIRTGIRYAKLRVGEDYVERLAYDKTKETIDPISGQRENELPLSTKTPYAENAGNIRVIFDQNTDLADRELLNVYISDEQKIKYLQIPLGMEGYLGKGRLQCVLQGGMQWNRVTFGDYKFKVSIKVEEREVFADKNLVFSETKNHSEQFWSAYAGLGLNYRLNGHWQLHGGLRYNYSFVKDKKMAFAPSNNVGRAFTLGLAYQF